jgi:hypothetical protein
VGTVVVDALFLYLLNRWPPFDTADDWSGWGLVAHLVLGLGIAGSAIGVVIGVVHLVQSCRRPD